MPELVNMYGIKYLIEGDVGSPEAKRLMREAKADLDILKENNVLELDHIRLDKPDKYLINSQFGEDTVYINIPFKEKKRRLILRSEEEKVKQEQETKYLIAFEAYNSTGQQIGYVICKDGALGGYEFFPTDNVINPHPIYLFNSDYSYHDYFAPDGYSEWGEWFLEQRALFPGIVYPFHFPDWKLSTGWADNGDHYRFHNDPDQYVSLANPYPLAEVTYPHSGLPPYKFIGYGVVNGKLASYLDVSQDTKFEEKLMDWITEIYPYYMEWEGAYRAFDSFITEAQESTGEEIQIHCEFWDPRDSSRGQIRGVKVNSTIVYEEYLGALTGITVTTKGKANKLYISGEETPIWTYFDQWEYPWIEALRYKGEGEYSDTRTGTRYRTVADARYWYEYNEILTYDNFSSVENLGYDLTQFPFSTFTALFYGWNNYSLVEESDNQSYSIVASVAESDIRYAALVLKYQVYNYTYDDYLRTGIPCNENFSPEYYAGMLDSDESACTSSTDDGYDGDEIYESFLIINDLIAESFGEKYLGFSFIRWWEEASWIALNLSFTELVVEP